MIFDVRTLYTSSILILGLVGLLLLWAWLQNRRSEALIWWALSFLVSTAGVVLLSDYDKIPDLWTVDVALMLFILAHGLVWAGVRSFVDRPFPWLGLIAGPAIWLIAYQTTDLDESTMGRVLLVATLSSAYTFCAIWVMVRDGAWKLRSGRLAIILLAAHTLGHVLRIPIADYYPYSFEADVEGIAMAGLTLEPMLFAVALGFVLLLMTRERWDAETTLAATTDVLTGSFNRRGFFEAADAARERAHRNGESVSLLLLDLDHFKHVNDTYGHAAGDEVLQSFTSRVRGVLHVDDIFGRIGGEEFTILMPQAGAGEAEALAERVRNTVDAQPIMWRANRIRVSVSVGLAVDPEAGRSLDELLEDADKALYEAKRLGRNQVVAARSDDTLEPVVDPNPERAHRDQTLRDAAEES
ncbi:GGDEF domain-containing protein [Amorphus coralli]|uniref:GGDEF domain-containing protein n=1 Tax=Amorphus coralli TaxID=340680 RepID=UPI00036B1244|nr:GGDEF domain-containing protein [Amorphus coralli]